MIIALSLLASTCTVAAGAEKPAPQPPTIEPGWIYCLGPETGKTRFCRMFQADGPPPRLMLPGEIIKQ
jgi:hypothetical protein